jgi:anti-sigma B factor antagonist
MIFTYKSSKQNAINIYLLKGELIDRNQANAIMEEINTAISKNENKILLNLKDLKYLNSSGLNVLINILTKARKSGGEVAICNVNKKINELLLITKLNNVFNVSNDEKKAISVLNK